MFEGIPIVGLTAPTLLLVAVLLIFTGRLIPQRYYKEKVEEATRWKLAYEDEKEARRVSNAQSMQLLESVKTNHAVIEAMFKTVREIKESGGSNVVP